MEALSALLKPYASHISGAAATVTYFHFLSGAVICNDIRKKKSTAGFSIVPFLGGLVM